MAHRGEQAFYRGSDRIIGGVCSGLAAGFHVAVLWIRIAFVLLAFVQGIGVLIYIVLWLVMPEQVEGQTTRSGFDSMAADVRRVSRDLQGQLGTRANESLMLGLVLVLVGAVLLGANTGLVSWSIVWPAAVIAIGVVLLVRTLQKKT
jgi:phage shock protein PspC (stress-responsive transcriptional regulator)